MRVSFWVLSAFVVAGCQRGVPPATEPAPVEPAIIEPATFSTWPSVTEKPVLVGAEQWVYCRPSPPSGKAHGPHANYSIIVRVSPDAIAAFRDGKALPAGAVVVKEKYADARASGPLHAYAVMTKREAGYDPGGGDWEYAYVTLVPERKVSLGQLAECARCHASAKEKDYLFRSYGPAGW